MEKNSSNKNLWYFPKNQNNDPWYYPQTPPPLTKKTSKFEHSSPEAMKIMYTLLRTSIAASVALVITLAAAYTEHKSQEILKKHGCQELKYSEKIFCRPPPYQNTPQNP